MTKLSSIPSILITGASSGIGATYTELWERAGIETKDFPKMMAVGELVDAALVGFDRRERVTIPPLQTAARWDALDVARQALIQDLRQEQVAERYRSVS